MELPRKTYSLCDLTFMFMTPDDYIHPLRDHRFVDTTILMESEDVEPFLLIFIVNVILVEITVIATIVGGGTYKFYLGNKFIWPQQNIFSILRIKLENALSLS